MLNLLHLLRRWKAGWLGVLFTIAGGVATVATFTNDTWSLWDRLLGIRPYSAELTPLLTQLVRETHEEHPVPGAARANALERELTAFAKEHRVRPAEVGKAGHGISRRFELAEASLRRGATLAASGDFAAARREFESVTAADPDNPAGWSNLAGACSLLGRYDEARAAYDRALLLEPGNWQTRYNFALLYARSGSPELGLPHLSQALASLRAGAGTADDLRHVLEELRNDIGLEGLRQTNGFHALVGG